MSLQDLNNDRWAKVRINPNRDNLFTSVAARLSRPDARARYEAVAKRTGVPWWFIAVVHEREASQKWSANIAQGDRWDRVSVHVPAGRGPFKSWEDAAVDALVNCAPYAARNKDWSPGGALTMLEKYNGLGYARKGIPSPYIWAGTNQYTRGKYVADGVFDPNTVDQQLGCAGLLIKMDAFKKKPPVGTEHGGAAAAIAAFLAATWEQLQQHPFIYGSIAIAIGIGTFAIIRNLKGK